MMRSSLSMFAAPGSRTTSTTRLAARDDEEDDAGVIGLDAEHETCVVRYFKTRLLLRYVSSSDGDDAASSNAKRAAFLSIYEPNGGGSNSSSARSSMTQPLASSSSSLLGKAPAVIILPPVEQKNQTSSSLRVTTAVFSIIPAEGFEKEPGQPVCYNDPVELVDQFGRILGIATRSPHAGHLAVDNHCGALVVIFERREVESASCLSQVLKSHAGLSTVPRDNPKYQLHKTLGLRRTSTGAPVAEICGGDRVSIPGLVLARKKQFSSGCVMQHKFFSDASADPTTASQPVFLECEVVVTSSNTLLPIDVNPLLGGNESVLAKSKFHMADRTATGEFVGVLHYGILHRRTDHTKIWKKRFFVLTQVALHRFEAHVTFESSKSVKSRGDLLIKDCRRVRYEKFARPHELDIEFNSGKVLSMHSDDAVSCAKWASVLSYAIESPQWIHAERSFTTFWRSSERYESPRCPTVERIEIEASQIYDRYCNRRTSVIDRPQWSEKLALGELGADDRVVVHLSSGNCFTLSLEDISRALLSPTTSMLHTVTEIDSISDRATSSVDLPVHLNEDVSRSSTFSGSRSLPKFQVRLRYRAELQLDRRIDIKMELGLLKMRLKFAGALLLSGFSPIYVMLRRYRGMPLLSMEWATSWRLEGVCRYQTHLFAVIVETLLLAAVAPLLWHSFATWYRQRLQGAKLQWFLTLVSLEMQPEAPPAQPSGGTAYQRSTFAPPSDVSPIVNSRDVDRQDEVHRFRLENALDTILGRPHFPYFAIKRYFPNRFLHRDEQGRRVLLVSLNAVDMTSLSNHNVSPFAVERYFLYLWEFIWSYSDFIHGVAHSELVVVLDCTHWNYACLFGRSVCVMTTVLLKTHRYYPGRLAEVVIKVNSTLLERYAQVFRAMLPFDLRAKCTIAITSGKTSVSAPQLDAKATTFNGSIDTTSADEQAFSEFALSLLSTYATVSIPSFTKRELDQAARFTKFGSLQSTDDPRTSSRGGDGGASTTRTRVGTRALLIPSADFKWHTVYQRSDFTVSISRKESAADSESGDAAPSALTQIAQIRGSMIMKSTDITTMLQCLHDPSQWRFWNTGVEEMTLLDTLTSHEDVCFWSRQIPFLGFSNDGNCIEDVKTTDSYFNCLVRRIHEERKLASGALSFIVLWKTTTSQHSIIHGPASELGRSDSRDCERGNAHAKRAPTAVQWKRFEDPTVTVCLVLEPRNASASEGCTAIDGVDLSFWYQVMMPTQRDSRKAIELAQALEAKFRSLDTFLQNRR